MLHDELNANYGVTELIRRGGSRPGTIDLRVSTAAADVRVAQLLAVDPGARLVVVDRTRTADDRPVARTTDYLVLDDLEGRGLSLAYLERWLGKRESLYEMLSDAGVAVHSGVAEISAVLANRLLAEALGVPKGAPLLSLGQVDYSNLGRPVLYSDEYMVPSELTVQVLRNGPG